VILERSGELSWYLSSSAFEYSNIPECKTGSTQFIMIACDLMGLTYLFRDDTLCVPMNGEASDDSTDAPFAPEGGWQREWVRRSMKALLATEAGDKVKVSGFPLWTITERIESSRSPVVVLEDENGSRNALLTPTGDAEGRPLEIWYIEFDDGSIEIIRKASLESTEAMVVGGKDWNECGCGAKIKTMSHYQKAYHGSEDHSLAGYTAS
jgi:hypothetical protein